MKCEVKITDFGVSDVLGGSSDLIGSPYWMAPEVVQERPYDARCDIWSLGITVIEMADGVPPMNDLHPLVAMRKVPTNPPPRLECEDQCSDEMVNFVKSCLIKDPRARPLALDLMLDPWMSRAEGPQVLRERLIKTLKQRRQRDKDQASAEALAAPKVDYHTVMIAREDEQQGSTGGVGTETATDTVALEQSLGNVSGEDEEEDEPESESDLDDEAFHPDFESIAIQVAEEEEAAAAGDMFVNCDTFVVAEEDVNGDYDGDAGGAGFFVDCDSMVIVNSDEETAVATLEDSSEQKQPNWNVILSQMGADAAPATPDSPRRGSSPGGDWSRARPSVSPAVALSPARGQGAHRSPRSNSRPSRSPSQTDSVETTRSPSVSAATVKSALPELLPDARLKRELEGKLKLDAAMRELRDSKKQTSALVAVPGALPAPAPRSPRPSPPAEAPPSLETPPMTVLSASVGNIAMLRPRPPLSPKTRSGSADQAPPSPRLLSRSAVVPSVAPQVRKTRGSLPETLPPFFEQVRAAFINEPEEGLDGFKKFIMLMRELKLEQITIEQVAKRARELFSNKPDLLLGFNAFLPSELRSPDASI